MYLKSCLFLWLSSAALVFGQEYRLGSKVEDFPLASLEGKSVRFAGLKGGTTAILFVSTKCPISNDYVARMKDLYREYSARGVRFVFINANHNEPPEEIRQHSTSHELPFPVYKDGNNDVADRFGAQFTPETYVIDRSSILRYHGAIDDSRNPARVGRQSLRLALEAVLAGRPVEIPKTRAFGCTIKRVKKVTSLTPLDEAKYKAVLAANSGKTVLVNFWATWCSPCRAEMPFLAALQDKLRPRGFVLVTVSADEPEQEGDAAAFLTRSGVGGPAYIKRAKDDDRFIRFVDPKWSGALPVSILYDRRGRKAASFVGEVEPAKIEAAVRKLL